MKFQWLWTTLLAFLALTESAVAGPPSIGFSFGYHAGPHVHRPYYYRPYPYYYRPYVLVEPAPVYVQPAPVYVQPAPAVIVPSYSSPAPTVNSAPPPITTTPVVQANTVSAASQKALLQQLDHPDENARREAALELGRNRTMDAIDPLCARLSSDASAQVREASARALGMIGSVRAMQTLQRTAVSDGDSLVRHSAQFALDVIHANQRR